MIKAIVKNDVINAQSATMTEITKLWEDLRVRSVQAYSARKLTFD